jgi:hypothetical protein
LYDVHPGVAMVQKWIGELKEKTGRTVEEWIALVQKEGPKTGHKARVEWLKAKHKMGNNSAWWIAERAEGKSGEEDTPEGYLEVAAKCRATVFRKERTAPAVVRRIAQARKIDCR